MSFIDFMSEKNNLDRHRVYGVTIGVVSDIEDPDQLGRVKVQLPIRLKEKVTCWARVAVPFAGEDKGFFMLPDVGDEVLVTFREGDIREPYIIGCLWNNKEKPEAYETESGKYNQRKIKFKTGHEIIVGEKQDEGFVEIKTKNGNSIFIDDKDDGKISIKTKTNKNKITIDGNEGKLKVESENIVDVSSGTAKISVDGQKNTVDIKSDTKIVIKSSSISIQASGNLDLKSDGMINIQGSMVKIN